MSIQAAVLFISGQSNAHAHAQAMAPEDRILQPLRNVFALDRKENQSFDIKDVVWSGFTTEGKNLGETQDHTYTLASFLAKRWQKAIDEGCKLPDLYIVQISIGSQGIINGMWNPDKEKVLKPGKLGEADIALYALAQHIYPLVMQNLQSSGKEPEVIGWHWLGSEQEVWNETYLREDMKERYNAFFDGMMKAIGVPCPLYLYLLDLQSFCRRCQIPIKAVEMINEALALQSTRFEKVTMIELDQCPYWDPEDAQKGIYAPDGGHYLAKTQEWFAARFWEEIREKMWFLS